MTIDVPFYGNLVLCLILLSSAYAFAMSLGAARGRPQLLAAARWGTYATIAFITLGICLLAYAFQTHDFRIRYVARYSDRSMPWWYLLTSLWGGQDGSLLWWSFLLGGYTFAVTRWLRGRYLELQPYVYATLMSIIAFFAVLMLFAANPFATEVGATPPDGEGLNPLLQNYWMVIHPPALYMGFVGWSVPFAFVVAGLCTGRLNEEWVKAAHLWAMIAWLFLSIGLLLGCLWSYEELGWGGYWAWDPVENASFMPWLVGTAYLHSAIVQERYGMLKVWNVFLMCLTFFMTIFGTFLTRSGMIASVHSFARSDIGTYFAWYLLFLLIACASLIVWRLPKLKADHKIHALLSREFMFLLNNWILLGMMIFVLVATTWPLISEWTRGEEVTVGPGFYNSWMVPFGLVLLALTGIGPLVSWRKATGKNLGRALWLPAAVSFFAIMLHFLFGEAIGFPAVVESEAIYTTATNVVLEFFQAFAPVASSAVCTFVIVGIGQEFWRGAKVRMKKGENFFQALARLVSRARRRYGGYIVHIGIVFMYIGFTGAAYDQETEAALRPGASLEVGDYEVRYDRPRTVTDPNKRAVFTYLSVFDEDGDSVGRVAPAKFIYRTHPEMPTTEVAIRTNLREDLYVIMSTVDPDTRRATFRVVVRPLVVWIWIGGLILVLGAVIAMWPRARDVLQRQETLKRRRRGGGAAAAAILLALAALSPTSAWAQSSSLHAGNVTLHDAQERHLFKHLLCQCGSCQRLPLDNCICDWAERRRTELRARMAAGETNEELIAGFRAQYGAAAISIPADEGMDRALWAVPVAGVLFGAGGVFLIGRRWRSRTSGESDDDKPDPPKGDPDKNYDDILDEELRKLEEGQ
ncbi:MAG: cytochrome c-type biogenesis CcmF C-terminal domain-containing protein [Myxococcota bacterium]